MATRAAVSTESPMARALHYEYVNQLTAAETQDAVAWVSNLDGARNVWVARGPAFTAQKLTSYTEDDGREITQLTFAPDGTRLVFVRGGDHDANWPVEGNLAPDPDASTEQPHTEIWAVSLNGGPAERLADGDAPAISSKGQLAYIHEDQVWSVPLGGGTPEKLFFDRGKDSNLRWSPDGRRLVFVSGRQDHAFIGIYSSRTAPLSYLAPSTGNDGAPCWSPDGSQVAFVRNAGIGGAPEPALEHVPHPWSVWVAAVNDGTGHAVWRSPNTLAGSYPNLEGEANLHWMADRLVFTAYLDEWPHLYSIPAAGGAATLLTPGPFMVEHVAESRDHRYVIYDANTGAAEGDDDRRHVFRVPIDRARPEVITAGESLEWTPVGAAVNRIAFIASGPRLSPRVALAAVDGSHRITPITAAADHSAPASGAMGFSTDGFVVPKRVTFRAADGLLIHGQLFDGANSTPSGRKPGIVFVHGGPERQMLLGWHYMDYYSNAYAVNQYLAAHGFVVLSVNYRLGIGYGRSFNQPDRAGYAGAAEYQDVVAGAHFLQSLSTVDPQRIGIWGGSYGGYLTALGLARDSELFKAGVDLHGVHDWSLLLSSWVGKPEARYEKGDRDKAMEMAWNSSPDAAIDGWKSPVLLVQGDDDRNVPFQQTIDLARRLDARNLPYEELVLPNEIHGFLRHASWVRVDEATVEFLRRSLGVH